MQHHHSASRPVNRRFPRLVFKAPARGSTFHPSLQNCTRARIALWLHNEPRRSHSAFSSGRFRGPNLPRRVLHSLPRAPCPRRSVVSSQVLWTCYQVNPSLVIKNDTIQHPGVFLRNGIFGLAYKISVALARDWANIHEIHHRLLLSSSHRVLRLTYSLGLPLHASSICTRTRMEGRERSQSSRFDQNAYTELEVPLEK